ncbi:hypothetical protein [Streptomyces sp. SID13726]|uniref:hypothetical protein n=1 Tax=Streptomyces sp. SID13726 TaxID=2706058 RepID=UPI0013BCC150|nr:hypothetical protein [Streptomyces sp. SID13726]NEB00241.1 hypothetical protein [Streptomyces sp. SID13726]
MRVKHSFVSFIAALSLVEILATGATTNALLGAVAGAEQVGQEQSAISASVHADDAIWH